MAPGAGFASFFLVITTGGPKADRHHLAPKPDATPPPPAVQASRNPRGPAGGSHHHAPTMRDTTSMAPHTSASMNRTSVARTLLGLVMLLLLALLKN